MLIVLLHPLVFFFIPFQNIHLRGLFTLRDFAADYPQSMGLIRVPYIDADSMVCKIHVGSVFEQDDFITEFVFFSVRLSCARTPIVRLHDGRNHGAAPVLEVGLSY